MKRTLAIILILILALGLLCGCGASADSMASAPTANTPAEAPAGSASDMNYGYAADMSEESVEAESSTTTTTTSASNPLANTKLIYTADINLETTEFDASIAGLEDLVDSMNGYFESSYVNNYGSYRSGNYSVRVPAEHFDGFCTAVGQLCQLNSISRSARDVSEAYYDAESRLLTQQTKLERLQALLAKAESMEDIITLESAISETEYNIEQLTGTLRKYDSLVGYSTVNICIDEVYKLTEIEEPVIGFGAKLMQAFKTGCGNFVDNLQRTLLRMARNWVGWFIFIVIVVVAVVIVLRVRKARKAKYAPVIRKDEEEKK